MTAQILQEELVKEIGVIFKDDLFKDSAGEYIKMNVYEQNLPIRQDEDAPDPIPYGDRPSGNRASQGRCRTAGSVRHTADRIF